MSYFIKELFYRLLIDPLLASVRISVLDSIDPSSLVIDIACGTGTLAIEIGRKVKHVVAIDLDSGMIEYAGSRARRKNLDNIRFESRDASDLSIYRDKEFDVAVTSMSVHQFEAELAVRILSEMRRIASTVIIIDYCHPLPANPAGQIARQSRKWPGVIITGISVSILIQVD